MSLKLPWEYGHTFTEVHIDYYIMELDGFSLYITEHSSKARTGWIVGINTGWNMGKFIKGTLEEAEQALIQKVRDFCKEQIREAKHLEKELDSLLK